MPLPHLDRLFDYLVPEADGEAAVPGTRVRVRFSGQLVDGWLLERVADTEHTGRLAYLERVVSAEPVLHPEVLRLARAVAERYAGSLVDVLRLAVPPRHARVEAEPPAAGSGPVPAPPAESIMDFLPDTPGDTRTEVHDQRSTGWGAYRSGRAFGRALAGGRSPRGVWTALPG
ncbi:MAG: primosome assembly protein PriA, partial [Natronosporangium sp.]